MCAFNYNLQHYSRCLSRNNIECTYNNRMFHFNNYKVVIGNSLENNSRGLGSFVGLNHEYFLYCRLKYAEIAVTKLKTLTNYPNKTTRIAIRTVKSCYAYPVIRVAISKASCTRGALLAR
jgi:hypothetical protein